MSNALPRAAMIFVAALMLTCISDCGRKSAEMFPASNAVPGWTTTGTTRDFPADKLWEYINGDAERYLQAGVERALTADYRYQEKVEAVAEIYIMKAPAGAQKILDSESAVGSQPLRLGDEARLFPASLVFRTGRFLVRLTAFQESPEISKALVELGKEIRKRLKVEA